MADGRLTMEGFACYAVLGHLAFNMTKKVAIHKAIEISTMVYDLTGTYGGYLPFSTDEFLELIGTHPDYPKLPQLGVCAEDIAEYLRKTMFEAKFILT
jgi:hypothetical protein